MRLLRGNHGGFSAGRKVGGGFNVRDLFGSTGKGFWLEAADMATSFQDLYGATPGALNAPVGVHLDKRFGGVATTEMIAVAADREFSSDTGFWSKGGGTISGGVYTQPSQYTSLGRSGLLTAGKTYEVSYTVVSGNTIRVQVGGAIGPFVSGAGTYKAILTAGSTDFLVEFGAVGGGVIENVSIKLLDGNHFFQATSTARPKLSQRKNRLTYSEDMTNEAWSNGGVIVALNNATAPDGTTTATRLTETEGSEKRIFQYFTDARNTISVYAKAGTARYLSISRGTTAKYATFDLQTGTVVASNDTTYGITAEANGFYRCWARSDGFGIAVFKIGSTIIEAEPGYTNPGANGAYLWLWHPQAEHGSLTNYQRIGSVTDYDTAGVLTHDSYDRVEDYIKTTFPAGTLSNNMDCFILMKAIQPAFILGSELHDGFGKYFGPAENSNNTDLGQGVGAQLPAFVIDGVGDITTRQQLNNAVTKGDWHVVEVRNIDLSAWASFVIGGVPNGAWGLDGHIAEYILCPAQDAATRTKIREYLANKVGVTL